MTTAEFEAPSPKRQKHERDVLPHSSTSPSRSFLLNIPHSQHLLTLGHLDSQRPATLSDGGGFHKVSETSLSPSDVNSHISETIPVGLGELSNLESSIGGGHDLHSANVFLNESPEAYLETEGVPLSFSETSTKAKEGVSVQVRLIDTEHAGRR
jgi:hypothetical protein